MAVLSAGRTPPRCGDCCRRPDHAPDRAADRSRWKQETATTGRRRRGHRCARSQAARGRPLPPARRCPRRAAKEPLRTTPSASLPGTRDVQTPATSTRRRLQLRTPPQRAQPVAAGLRAGRTREGRRRRKRKKREQTRDRRTTSRAHGASRSSAAAGEPLPKLQLRRFLSRLRTVNAPYRPHADAPCVTLHALMVGSSNAPAQCICVRRRDQPAQA